MVGKEREVSAFEMKICTLYKPHYLSLDIVRGFSCIITELSTWEDAYGHFPDH